MIYCIKRKASGTFITVQGNRPKPAVLGFRDRQSAQNILRFYRQLETRIDQEIIVDKVDLSTMIKMCTNTSLDICVMGKGKDEGMTFVLKPDDNYRDVLDLCYSGEKFD